MAYATVLFVDDNDDFRETRSRFLTDSGFLVMQAATPETATNIVDRHDVDLAIVDMRLRNDFDPEDESGLDLAFSEPMETVPCIILSAHTRTEAMCRVIRNRGPRYLKFISKYDEVDAFIETVCDMAFTISESRRRPTVKPIRNNKVFVVHGHDDGTRELVARTLEKVGLEPIILAEQAGGGRTIIEQLERHSDVGFAIVLLTPDDVGYSKQEGSRKRHERARQNVIFELGYFMGKLGRPRVRSLFRKGVELLSDYHGVIFLPIEGDWKLKLCQELRDAGYHSIDPSKLL